MTKIFVTVAILAGGASRRMGRDKAAIEIDGLPLLERTARLARAVSPSVIVVGRAQPSDWPLPDVSFVEDESPGEGPLGGLATALRQLEKLPPSQRRPPPPPILGEPERKVTEGDPTREQGDAAREQGDAAREQGDPTREQGDPTREQGDPTREQGDPTGRPYAVSLLACDLPALTPEALSWLVQTAQDRSHILVDGLVTVNNGRREPLFSVYTPHCLPWIGAHLSEGKRSLQSLINKGDFQFVELPPAFALALVNINTPGDLDAWSRCCPEAESA